ncbi:MAG: helix-turn-helix transcriptional regulator [Burkholderiaceae bacterium]
MDFSSLIGQRVAEERKRLGLSQEQAGNVGGVSREMWGRYERGGGVMGTEVLARFATAGADALYILTGQRAAPAVPMSSKPPLSADEAQIVDRYRKASKDGRDLISMAAKAADRELAGKKKRAA